MKLLDVAAMFNGVQFLSPNHIIALDAREFVDGVGGGRLSDEWYCTFAATSATNAATTTATWKTLYEACSVAERILYILYMGQFIAICVNYEYV